MDVTSREASPFGDPFDPLRTDHSAPDHYKIRCATGARFLIYRATALGGPTDHDPGKWYFQPLPLAVGFRPGDSFERPELAEAAARRLTERTT